MHLKTQRNKRQVDAAWERANAAAERTVRETAVGWLATQIQIGRAGFDPYDETILDAEARTELQIDDANLPLMEGEPLASRSVDGPLPERLKIVDLDRAPEPQLQLVGAETPTPGMAAVREARTAYDSRTVCPTCRGTGGGVYNDCPTCDGNGEVA